MWRREVAAAAAAPTSPECPYHTLGVARGASVDECKEAFRQLALAVHPDVGGDAARFARVVGAWEYISLAALASEASARPRALRGVRNVDGILLVSVSQLKADPLYEVHTLRIGMDDAEGESYISSPTPAADAAHTHPPITHHAKGDGGSASRAGGAEEKIKAEENLSTLIGKGGTGGALGTERVHLVRATPFDSIADLCDAVDAQVSCFFLSCFFLLFLCLSVCQRRDLLCVFAQLELPPDVRGVGQRDNGNELVWGAQLLAEHLFVRDYPIRDGDTLYYVVQRWRHHARATRSGRSSRAGGFR